jgi:hypothetical protein
MTHKCRVPECTIIGSVAKLIVTGCYLQLVVFFTLEHYMV